MTQDTTYNGWSNYPTWRINLEIVEDYISSLEEGEIQFNDAAELADHLGEMVDEVLTNYGEGEETYVVSLARSFVSQVDFYEIAATQATGDDAWLIAGDEEDDE